MHYSTVLSDEVKVVRGLPAEWERCSRTVSLDSWPLALLYHSTTIAIGSAFHGIIILDAISGSKVATLSGHTGQVGCLTFSSDGKSLVSGSHDGTVKLWDMQTGGAVRTFHGQHDWFLSVSISADCTRIASGSDAGRIFLWDTKTGECHCTIEQQFVVECVSFSPIHPQHIISISGSKVWQWDFNGHQIPPTYDGSHIAFSPDHTQFALCNEGVVTVQNSDSRAIVAEFHVTSNSAKYCCFSPDGRLVAAAASDTSYVWDITSPSPHLVETFVGHTDDITSLAFSSSSSLISAAIDGSVKFWKVGILTTDPAAADPRPTPPTSAPIESVSLQARAGIAISSDADGVVKTWDLSTGLCKASFQTPILEAIYWGCRNVQLVDGRLIFVWYEDNKIHILDIEKGELLQTLDTSGPCDIRISGDGSKIFSLGERSIQVWSMWAWELVGEVELEDTLHLDPLCTDSSVVWVQSPNTSIQKGWDFGILGSQPIPLDLSAGRPHLDFISGTSQQTGNLFWIKDTATGKEVFQLTGIYAWPNNVQWDGQYLVAGYGSGEVLILDFHHVVL